MSTGLLTQLHSYYSQIDEAQDPIRPAEVAQLLEKVREPLSKPPQPVQAPSAPVPVRLRDTPPRGLRWVYGMAAAVVALVLVGGVAWLSRSSPEADPDDPTPVITQAPTETTVITPDVPLPVNNVLLGPGRWSVAATFTNPSVSSELLRMTADEVRGWPGVVEVAEAQDESAWRDLTGLESQCGVGDLAPPCGSGLAILTINSSMTQTAIRLESEMGMTALTPIDVPTAFVEGYVDAAIESASPVPLEFDTSSLGTEQPLSGPFLGYEPDDSVCSGPCDFGVEVEVDGLTTGTGIVVDQLITTIEDLLIDRAGGRGVLGDLRYVLEGRRVYRFAFLPLEAAVVTFEQDDGSTVWQRPLGGMALMVDSLGSGLGVEDGFIDHDQQALIVAGPFLVLNAAGVEIMRIQDSLDSTPPLIEDLRVKGLIAPPTEVTVAGLNITDTVAIDNPDPLNSRIVGTGDAVWVPTQNSIIRIDAATRVVTDTIPIEGRIVDLVADTDSVWTSSATAWLPEAGHSIGMVSRIDAATGRITDEFEVPGRLWIADGGLWVSHWAGIDRIDLSTLSVDTYAYPEENQVGSSGEWLGETDGALWLLDGRDGQSLTRIDLASGQTEHYGLAFDPSPEMGAALADNAVWLIDWGTPEGVGRFDLDSGELTYLPSLGIGRGRFVHTEGAVWAWSRGETITRIDTSTHQVTDVIDLPASGGVLTAPGDGFLWVGHSVAVSRIDTTTRQLTHVINLETEVWGLLAFDQAIWVVGENTITRIDYP